MGAFYVHKDGVVQWQGMCPDGDETHQAPAGYSIGLGQPPASMMPLPPGGNGTPYFMRRRDAYPPVTDQLDMLWHAMDDGLIPRIEPMYSQIKAVKDRFPKPSN